MLTAQEAAAKTIKLSTDIRTLSALGKTIAAMASKQPVGSVGRIKGTETAERLLKRAKGMLDQLNLYASFAADVPESVLQDRLK